MKPNATGWSIVRGPVLSFCFTATLRASRQLVQAAPRLAGRTFPIGLPDQTNIWIDLSIVLKEIRKGRMSVHTQYL